MEYVKIQMTDCGYMFSSYCSDEMATLGAFFASEVGCCVSSTWSEWFLYESEYSDQTSGNSIIVEREGENIYMSEIYDFGPKKRLKISRQNLIQLLTYWREKVCIEQPKNVIIRGDNGVFVMEIYDSED